MLQAILNRLKAKAEELLAEEQAGWRPGRSTVEQIFNLSSCHREATTTPPRSVPQFHRLQGVWQSLACRPAAGLQKFQYRGRTGSSHSGTIWQLHQCSPLEQSAREVLQDNSRCPLGMLTLTHPVTLVLREDYAGNIPWPPHIHLHWWKAHKQPTICRWHRSYWRQQWWT